MKNTRYLNNLEIFSKIFSNKSGGKGITRAIKKSIVPIPKEKDFDKNKIIKELYEQIITYEYHPCACREYIVLDKHNYVARIIPVFEPKDYYLYYFCIKMIEDEIAINRVNGTFGGWSLGTTLREREKEEWADIEYCLWGSIDPSLWKYNWKEFQKLAKLYGNMVEYKYVIKFDLANFYNRINLDLLERKVYAVLPFEKRPYAELLFHFLNNWNKKYEGYSSKIVGVPQDEIGDFSRLLANFYLQDYDKYIAEICEKYNSKYIRYSDDQMIFADTKDNAKLIFFYASKYLYKLGLDINSSKVIDFCNIDEYNKYWAFEIFELLEDKDNKENINKAIKTYREYTRSKIKFKNDSVLKRILSMNFELITKNNKKYLFSEYINENFLSRKEAWVYCKIYEKLSAEEKKKFIEYLISLVDKIHFNYFHYNLMIFFDTYGIKYDSDHVNDIIKKLRLD